MIEHAVPKGKHPSGQSVDTEDNLIVKFYPIVSPSHFLKSIILTFKASLSILVR